MGKHRVTEEVQTRLSTTAQGNALLELLQMCGGRSGLASAIKCNRGTVDNFVARGQISMEMAERIADVEHFKKLGWTREKIRPDVNPFVWDRGNE